MATVAIKGLKLLSNSVYFSVFCLKWFILYCCIFTWH